MSNIFIIHDSEENKLLIALHCSDKLTVEDSVKKIVRSGSPHFVKHRSELPDYISSPFFDALVADYEAETISVDMEKARSITQDMIREERKLVFEELDIEYQRATETEDRNRMKEVAALKQVLRDLPASPAIQEAKTPEELEHLARNAVKEVVEN
jgi:hypothetical protein